MTDDPLRVGVLSFHESKESKAILNAADALGAEPVWLRGDNLLTEFRVDVGRRIDDPSEPIESRLGAAVEE